MPEGEFGGEEERFNFSRLINHKNKEYATEEALDLLNRIFVYDHVSSSPILERPYQRDRNTGSPLLLRASLTLNIII